MKSVLLEKEFIGGEDLVIKVLEDMQFVILGAEGNEMSLKLIFEKPEVSAEIIGIFNLRTGENIKLKTSSVHKAPQSSCSTFIKAVLNDNSAFDYRGEILIEKNAQQTTAYLHDNVLVAGENTKRNSQPILEIEANDVKASHGSTTGRIDESQLYYLESRGLEKPQAEEIIKEGFLAGLVGKIADLKIREKALNKLKFEKETL